jgi:acetyl-CoA acetyltransferase
VDFATEIAARFPANIAISGIGVTRQARKIEQGALHLSLEAVRSAIADAGIERSDIDGVAGRWPGPGGSACDGGSADWANLLGIPARWIDDSYPHGVPAVLSAAAAISAGFCHTVLVVGGQVSGPASPDELLAHYTQPANEFVAPFGSFTAAQFALVAQIYLERHRPSRRGMAQIAATIRNMGHINPDAVMAGRGPYTADDILASPLIVEPFHLLELCLTSEGAVAMVITTVERASDGPNAPVHLLGGGAEWARPQYVEPPRYDDVWMIGADAAHRMWGASGVRPADIDVAQLYDANSWEVVRQFEALGFCNEGEGLDFALEIGIGLEGQLPTNTDGGMLSYSAPAWAGTTLKITEAVLQLRGAAGRRQVRDAELALVSGAGSGAQYYNVLLLRRDG